MRKLEKFDAAREFSLELRKEIGIDNLLNVNELNARESNKYICHSHDYCDANQVMIDILEITDEDVEFKMDLITEIWDIARKENFFV